MKIEIRNRFTNEIIYECGAESLRAALEECAKLGRDLSRAYLSRADLSGSDLYGANLYGSDLSGSDLSGANLSGANLSRANLSRAYLSRANLSGAKGAELVIAQTRILPEGSIIGYKKVRTPEGTGIVVLQIPPYAKRSHAFGRKCRCEFAEVIEAPEGAYTSEHGPLTKYKVGEIVKPDKWDDNWQDECSNGIHFFITKLEAEAYQ